MLKKRNCHQLRRFFPTAITNIIRSLALLVVATIVAQGAAPPSIVAIVKGDNPDHMVAEAIELCGGLKDLIRAGRTVVIKPNLTSLREGQVYPGQIAGLALKEYRFPEVIKNGEVFIGRIAPLHGGHRPSGAQGPF